jgi:hypothetical protein
MSLLLLRGRESRSRIRFTIENSDYKKAIGLMEQAHYGELYKFKTLQLWLVFKRSEKKSNSSRTKNVFTTP